MPRKKVRYAVVGLGHIAQVAVLPAFQHATKNSELTALVSNDPGKLRQLGRRYEVDDLYSYDEYDLCLRSGRVDAVYIALPNHLHRQYAVAAARRGVHILCEKPLAVTASDCQSMIRAAQRNDVRLMTAYRLHFEEANMGAIDILRSGQIGEPRIFHSLFTMNVRAGDIRLQQRKGGGTLYDIGVYCINAARYLFRSEPIEVTAVAATGDQKRFRGVEEMISATLRFPGDRLASFVCSFGTDDNSAWEVVGTKGTLRLDPAYSYAGALEQRLTIGGKTRAKSFPGGDQFAPELIYFSECVLNGRDPEPSGLEGLADIRIVEALYRSARSGKRVALGAFEKRSRPSSSQVIRRPPVRRPRLVKARPPKR